LSAPARPTALHRTAPREEITLNHREDEDQADTTIYKVVVNHEEQYSIWPADRENPLGWRDGGKTGAKAECLAYINEVWTDMRPLSLRRQMEEAARQAPPQASQED
jgi:MbtH protein